MITPQVAQLTAATADAAKAETMSVAPGTTSAGPDRVADPAVVSPRRAARMAARDELAAAPRSRDSDWGAQSRTQEDDLGWAAKRAAVTIAAAMLQACDGDTETHCDDLVHLCDLIAEELGIHGNDRAELLAAAQLHDIGKVGIASNVLNKRGPLDDYEWSLVRQHTIVGERVIRSVPQLEEVGRLVRHSHEPWDGGGYPTGCRGADPARQPDVFCADTFHAIARIAPTVVDAVPRPRWRSSRAPRARSWTARSSTRWSARLSGYGRPCNPGLSA